MENHIFINAMKEMEFKWGFIAPLKYSNVYFALDISYNFLYYMYPVLVTHLS